MKLLITLMALFASSSLIYAKTNYTDYAKYLDQNWPLPVNLQSSCGIETPNFWINKTEELISVEPINKIYSLDTNEKMILKNLLISQAYNRLFTYSLENQKKEIPQIKFYWLAAGSQASVTVGHALQRGLKERYLKNTRQRNVFERLENLYEPLPAIPSILLSSIGEIKKRTAENNWRVYNDIFWQHLVYLTCGKAEIIRLNEYMIDQMNQNNQYAEAERFHRFINVWKDMDSGKVIEANMQLIYIEQFNILQKYMYDSIDAKLANSLLFFNQMAKADLQGPEGRKIIDFTKYSLTHGRYPNLGYFPTRFKWMKYVVGEQAAYIDELENIPAIEDALSKSLYETYQTINFYLK